MEECNYYTSENGHLDLEIDVINIKKEEQVSDSDGELDVNNEPFATLNHLPLLSPVSIFVKEEFTVDDKNQCETYSAFVVEEGEHDDIKVIKMVDESSAIGDYISGKEEECDEMNTDCNVTQQLDLTSSHYYILVRSEPDKVDEKIKNYSNVQRGKKELKCRYCNKMFKRPSYLKRHLLLHLEKPYTCDECDKSFSELCYLKAHMRIHSGEKPYVCNLCQKSFSRPGHLSEHVRIHTGHKPHVCVQCQKSFYRSRDLVRHLRTHTGQKPYTCVHCAKSFSIRSNLIRHQSKH